MKKRFLLGLSVLISSIATAQTVQVDVTQKKCELVNDSLIVHINVTGNVNDLSSRDALLMTPYVSANKESVNLPYIQLNGKYKHILYTRNKQIRARMKNVDSASDKYVLPIGADGKFAVDYRAAIKREDWMERADIQIRCENLDVDNELKELSNIYVHKMEHVDGSPFNNPIQQQVVDNRNVMASTNVKRTTSASSVQSVKTSSDPISSANYKGSYLAPDTDAVDERNQRDLNFNLEEAQVMADINPQILSLKELYTVAMSHKENRDKFYDIINTCVKLYPTHPTANLNAAAMAIEMGDVKAASKYLQIAPYESLAYKNCRGAYELMIGNIYEGIRLLKKAKAEGSEEAGYNLDLFFKSNR